jgi:phosphate transport system protein
MTRTQYTNDLEAVHKNIVEMGETSISLLGEALHAVVETNPESSARASELEAQTDHQHRMIHEQCFNLITLQAPVAGDARLITGILDAIVDLELVGDYAYEIVTLTSSMDKRPPSQILAQIVDVGRKIRELLSVAIDSWRNRDRAQALSVRPREAPIRADCETLYTKLSQLISSSADGLPYVDLMLICKHLERILRHTVSIADEAADAAPLGNAVA